MPSEKIGIFCPFPIRIPPAGKPPTLPEGRDIDLLIYLVEPPVIRFLLVQVLRPAVCLLHYV